MSQNNQLEDILGSLKGSEPTFETTLLSDKDFKVEFRSMHVKDQKTLVMETENETDLVKIKSLAKILKNCLITNLNIDNLYLQDFIWLLLNLQIKSTGESIELEGVCSECGEKGPPTRIDLDKGVKKKYLKDITNDTIKVNNNLIIHLALPKVSAIFSMKEDSLKSLDSLISNIDYVEFNDNVVELNNDGKLDLLDNLSPKDIKGFEKFMESNDFGVNIKLEFKCRNPKCKKDNSIDISNNIYDFF